MPASRARTISAAGMNTAAARIMAHARNRMSPAPISTPSSTKATAFTGWTAATQSSRKLASTSTSGSSVKQRQPHRLDRLMRGLPLVARTQQPVHPSRGAVGQEYEDRVERRQHARRDRDPPSGGVPRWLTTAVSVST
jgi:hypothetical protein